MSVTIQGDYVCNGCGRPNFGEPGVTCEEDGLKFCGYRCVLKYIEKVREETGEVLSASFTAIKTGIDK